MNEEFLAFGVEKLLWKVLPIINSYYDECEYLDKHLEIFRVPTYNMKINSMSNILVK